MLVYMALLGLSLCGGSSISISRLCLYLSGRDGEPTVNTQKHNCVKHWQAFVSTKQKAEERLSCSPLMVEGAEFIIWEGAEWVELRLEEEGLACRWGCCHSELIEPITVFVYKPGGADRCSPACGRSPQDAPPPCRQPGSAGCQRFLSHWSCERRERRRSFAQESKQLWDWEEEQTKKNRRGGEGEGWREERERAEAKGGAVQSPTKQPEHAWRIKEMQKIMQEVKHEGKEKEKEKEKRRMVWCVQPTVEDTQMKWRNQCWSLMRDSRWNQFDECCRNKSGW